MQATNLTSIDTHWLMYALDLAEKALFTSSPNPRVGCVICKNNTLQAQAWHQQAGQKHAERLALEQTDAKGATVYISLEPCAHHGRTPPCVEALIAAMPKTVVIATVDPNPMVQGLGIACLREAGIEVKVAAVDSPPAVRASQLNVGFFSRMQRQKPWVRLKIATTMDGKTALENGLSRWITNTQSRADAHALRARSCAVLTGIGTAVFDNPQLTVRHVKTSRQPLRILVDSHFRVNTESALFADNHVMVATAVLPKKKYPFSVFHCPDGEGKVNLSALLQQLAKQEINELTVEAGRKLNGAFLKQNLVDEIVLYLAPRIFGENARDMFSLSALASPDEAPAFSLIECQCLGEDVKLVYQRRLSATKAN